MARSAASSVWRVKADPLVRASAVGPLSGDSVAVKDIFAVAGQAIGAGVPRFLSSRDPETEHAAAVRQLLDAGADIRGIVHLDQMAYSLTGVNEHYGTPPNPRRPMALPGGSSGATATAVASHAVTIGLGTDTAGSIQVPALYQELWGVRTTHDRVSKTGLVPLAPDFDAVGVLTRSHETIRDVLRVLLPPQENCDLVTSATRDDLDPAVLTAMAEGFRVHQAYQAWAQHGGWISAHPSALMGPVAERFAFASRVTTREDSAALKSLARCRRILETTIGTGVLILELPSALVLPSSAPAPTAEHVRQELVRFTCIAPALQRPAIVCPPRQGVESLTIAIGPRDSDLALVDFAVRLLS